MRNTALLALADGTVFEGSAFGAQGEAVGEIVFNTSLTGYQEILTDPSYKGQIVTMTYPEIGNVGVNAEDVESRQPCVEGFVVKEYWERPSNCGPRRAWPPICASTILWVFRVLIPGRSSAAFAMVALNRA